MSGRATLGVSATELQAPMKPSIPALQERLATALLPKFPEIHHIQVYRDEADALVLWISVPWPVPFKLWEEDLPRLTRDVEALLPIAGVQVNELGVLTVADIRRCVPEPWIEHPSEQQVKNWQAQRELLTELALLTRTLLTISREGIYLGVQVRHGGQCPGHPAWTADEMLGRTVAEVCGQQTHDKIVGTIKKTIAENRAIVFGYSCTFRGESESLHFQATCKPIPDGSGAWLAVARIG